MKFDTLSRDIQQLIKTLPGDQRFQDIFAHDPQLDALDEAQRDLAGQKVQMQDLCGFTVFDGHGDPVKSLTLRKLGCLWGCNNGFINNSGKITYGDVQVFMYILNQGDDQLTVCNPEIIQLRSKGFLVSHSMKPDQAVDLISNMIRVAFRPMRYLKGGGSSGQQKQPNYGGQWMSSICSAVYRQTGWTPQQTLRKPLNVVMNFLLQDIKQKSKQQLKPKTSDQIKSAKNLRSCQIIVDYLISEKGVDPSLRQGLVDQMASC